MLVGLRPQTSVLAGPDMSGVLPSNFLSPTLTGVELALRKIDHLFYATTDSLGLATMAMGSLGFGLGRLATAKAMTQWAPRLWQARPWLGHLMASLGGLGVEAGAFSNFPRAVRSLRGEAMPWDGATLIHDYFKTGLQFGMLRSSGLAGTVFFQNPVAKTLGAGAAALVPAAATGLGIYSNAWVEEKLGWHPALSRGQRFWNSLETLAEFQVAGWGVHHFLGKGYIHLQGHLEGKFQELQRSWQFYIPSLGKGLLFNGAGRGAIPGNFSAEPSLQAGAWYNKSDEALIAGSSNPPPISGITRQRSEPPPPESIQFELVPGMKLGKDRYEVLELLGTGGMAQVWRLYDTVLEREVAGKIALPKFRRTMQDRFETEYLLQAHLPRNWRMVVFDLLEVTKGLKMLLMEFVPGKDLVSLVRWLRDSYPKASKAYPVEKRIQIFANICMGTEATHNMGILHRDLKPDNIRLASGENVLIFDYGVAARIRDVKNPRRSSSFPPKLNQALDHKITQDGLYVGTPGYVPLEVIRYAEAQANGKNPEPFEEPRQMDVFALGVILFELMTGHHPLGEYAPGKEELNEPRLIPIRDTQGNTKILDHRIYDLETVYIPPPFKDFHPELDTSLHSKLEKIALRAMSPDLNIRYRTAKELRHAVLMAEPELTYEELGQIKDEIHAIERQLREAEPNFRRRRGPKESLELTQLEQRARYLKKKWEIRSERLANDLNTLLDREKFPAAQHMIAKVSADLLSEGGSRLHPEERENFMKRIRENDVPFEEYTKPVMSLALDEGVPVQLAIHPIHEPLKEIRDARWMVTRLVKEKDSHGDETGNLIKGNSIAFDPYNSSPALEQGYYIFEVSAPGYAPMNVPILLSYEKIKQALQREKSLFFDLEMVPADWVPNDMVVVHRTTGFIGHNFYYDGDTKAANSFPLKTYDVPTIAVSRDPVSVRQYKEFIEDLILALQNQPNSSQFRGGLDEIEALLPRTTISVEARGRGSALTGMIKRAFSGQEATLYWRLARDRVLGVGPTLRAHLIDPTTHLDPFGEPIHLDHPISAISPESGISYKDWRSKKDGKGYEVLDVDIKNVLALSSFDIRYPWGNGPMTDSYVVSRGAFEDVSRASPQIIGTHPLGPEYYRDESCYIRDAIGNVREFTSTQGEPDHLCLSGGCVRMYPGANFSPASRYQAHRKSVVDSDGAFRLMLRFPKK